MQGTQTINETRIAMADPTALGVFGLSMVTLVAAAQKFGWVSNTTFVIPWAMFLGSIAQIWASTVDFKKGNYFGATVLGAYGLFWMAVAMHWAIAAGWFGDVGQGDPKAIGFAFLGYLVFSLFITVTSFETNKVFAAILVLIDVLLLSLTLATFGIYKPEAATIAAISELGISMLGFYAAGALFLNGFYGRTILPLGKPLGLIQKGAAPAVAVAAKAVPAAGARAA